MPNLPQLFQRNRAWSEAIRQRDPEFFLKLSKQQSPEYLWIGCADSRVPANEIVDLLPGELFVHRNIANVVVHTDLNCLSVVQFAVDVLKVKHIMITGHYGCGGVKAALDNARIGLADNWIHHVHDVREKHQHRLECVRGSGTEKLDRLCELNVIEQVVNLCRTTVVRDAWAHGQFLRVHGWIYGLKDGLIRDLHCSAGDPEEAARTYAGALAALDGKTAAA